MEVPEGVPPPPPHEPQSDGSREPGPGDSESIWIATHT